MRRGSIRDLEERLVPPGSAAHAANADYMHGDSSCHAGRDHIIVRFSHWRSMLNLRKITPSLLRALIDLRHSRRLPLDKV